MKKFVTLTLTMALLMPLTAQTSTNTYEDIRQQIEAEADHTVQTINAKFGQTYIPAIIRTSLSAIACGVLIPLAIHATIDVKSPLALACLYSGLASLAGYLTILQHNELMAFRETCDRGIANADHFYHKKLAHIHTRHYLGDIAKFQMAALEELAEKYFSFVKEDSKSVNSQE
jgi:hypothetical protein